MTQIEKAKFIQRYQTVGMAFLFLSAANSSEPPQYYLFLAEKVTDYVMKINSTHVFMLYRWLVSVIAPTIRAQMSPLYKGNAECN